MSVIIDATAYPHIVERIIHYAPHATLVQFRRTSRTYRALADAALGFHVVLSANNYLRPPHHRLPVFYQIFKAWWALGTTRLQDNSLNWLNSVRILDVEGEYQSTIPLGYDHCMLHLHTIRLRGRGVERFNPQHPHCLPPAQNLIILAPPPSKFTCRHGQSNEGFSDIGDMATYASQPSPYFRVRYWQGFERIVLNFCEPHGPYLSLDYVVPPTLRELVIIPLDCTFDDIMSGDEFHEFTRVCAARNPQVQCIFVSSGKYLERHFRVAQSWNEFEAALAKCGKLGELAVASPNFRSLTFDEYREMVGEEQFALETDERYAAVE